MRTICIVTATRAEYGLLKPLIKRIVEDSDLSLRLIVTGMHLSPEFGLTYREIEEDGFTVDEKIEILMSSDTPIGISKSMGLAMISFSEYFNRTNPALLIVLGDRYEIFAAVSSAVVARIPIAHIHGGETTEGAFDEAFRHSITKMSYLHFTSTEEYRTRVIQLGENPSRVYNVGTLGMESILNLNLLNREELEKSINFPLNDQYVLVTFHPVTLEDDTAKNQFQSLLDALSRIKNLKIIFTKANADTNGRVINAMIDQYVRDHPSESISFASMGQLRYLSAMKYSSMVIGNSSSGLLEAPSFGVPTINIGDRQKGRLQADSVINCEPLTTEIEKAISLALTNAFREKASMVISPYGDGSTSSIIVSVLKDFLMNSKINLKKKFFDCKVI